jgi:hypothetical protein
MRGGRSGDEEKKDGGDAAEEAKGREQIDRNRKNKRSKA